MKEAKKAMQKKVEAYIKEYSMVKKGSRVIAAVSGGADSVCLLHLLVQMKRDWELQIQVIHVHHGLRGAEADRDAEFVKKLSEELGVPCLVVYRDVAGYGREHGLSEEEAGRILRYRIFEEEADRLGADRIAVAHHREDQAETILHNLFRGSGLKGLGGMTPVRDRIIRPLLCVSRKEIEQYLEEHRIPHCEDSTNASQEYTRNKLRCQLIPQICREINPAAVEHIAAAGERIAEAEEYLQREAERIWKEQGCCRTQDGEILRCGIRAEVLSGLPQILKGYVVFLMIGQCCGLRKDITARHISQVLDVAQQGTGRETSLPYGLRAIREYDMVWIVKKSGPPQLPRLEMTRFQRKKDQEIPKNTYTKWFDYDRIKGTLSVRTRAAGDFITLKDGKRKTVKAFMIDEKIPREERDRIALLTEGHHVLWIVGYRISEYYKITDETEQILQVSMMEEMNMADKIRVLLTEKEVNERISEVAAAINRDYEGQELHLICVLKGGVFFTCELAKRITVPVSLDFMSVSSYGAGTVSSGVVKIIKDLDEPLEGKNVLIVEDIIDSGRTLAYLIEILKQRGPKSIHLCTLLDKPERRVKKQVKVDYTCFTIPDEFVVGYGLDYDQKYRNLPYIGVVEQ